MNKKLIELEHKFTALETKIPIKRSMVSAERKRQAAWGEQNKLMGYEDNYRISKANLRKYVAPALKKAARYSSAAADDGDEYGLTDLENILSDYYEGASEVYARRAKIFVLVLSSGGVSSTLLRETKQSYIKMLNYAIKAGKAYLANKKIGVR